MPDTPAAGGVKVTAILDGGDQESASVAFLLIPEGMDLAAEEAAHREWYRDTYCPAYRNRALARVEYLNFTDWLIQRGAVRAGPEHITEYRTND